MVRLKEYCAAVVDLLSKFQFHNGSIKRRINRDKVYRLQDEFQFHNGSIKSGTFDVIAQINNQVSIPQWFD